MVSVDVGRAAESYLYTPPPPQTPNPNPIGVLYTVRFLWCATQMGSIWRPRSPFIWVDFWKKILEIGHIFYCCPSNWVSNAVFSYLRNNRCLVRLTKSWAPGVCDHTTVPILYCSLQLIHPSAAYMRQWTGSSLIQVMACRLFARKPLPEPMLIYCQLVSWEQVSMKFESKFYHFHSRKYIWKCIAAILSRGWMS